jgi:hypothetical protein
MRSMFCREFVDAYSSYNRRRDTCQEDMHTVKLTQRHTYMHWFNFSGNLHQKLAQFNLNSVLAKKVHRMINEVQSQHRLHKAQLRLQMLRVGPVAERLALRNR